MALIVFPRFVGSASGGGGGGGDATQLADWVTRSTATGVVQAIRFDSSSAVSTYTHQDGQQANVTRNATGGVIGDGSLRIDFPAATGANPGGWRAPMNSSWTTDGQGFGSTEHYVQYRVKLGKNILRQSTGGGGNKFSIFGEYKFSSPNSSGSHTSCEVVVNNQNWRQSLFAYREHPVSGTTGFDTSDGVGIHLQPAVDRGAGVSDNNYRYALYESGLGSTGCWYWQEETWITVYIRLKIVDYGGTGTGNEIDIYAAREDESTYTQLFNNRDFRIGSDSLVPNGNNGVWFTIYDTNRTSAAFDTYAEWDQLIVSTLPIACPLPLTTKPTWITSGASSTRAWFNQAIQIDDAQTYTEPPGGTKSGICAYSGAALIGKKVIIAGGGHADSSANAVIALDLSVNTPAYSLLRSPTASVTADVTHYGDGRPSSRHTGWEIQGISQRDRVFFFGAWALYGVAIATNKVDAFDMTGLDYEADGTWGTISGLQSGNAPNGLAQDRDGNVWVACCGNNNVYKWTQSTATWSTPLSLPATFYDTCLAYDPVRHRMVYFHSTAGRYIDCAANTSTAITWGGSQAAQIDKGSQAFWCNDIGRFLYKKFSSQTVYSIHPETYAAEVFTTTGSTPSITSTGYDNVYGRFNWVPSLGTVFLIQTNSANFYAFRTR